MEWHNYLPIIVTIGSIAGAIAALTIFFTLWGVVDRAVRGVGRSLVRPLPIADLTNQTVRVHLKSKAMIEGVTLQGYHTAIAEGPFQFRELLVARLPDGRSTYIRIEEIEYLETLNATVL